ncbi:MAG: hypothetical protein VX265_05225 [Myxococcota bacterium]|nr:hypothetical protein [Myxococcota bacterium]MEC8425243.1 hypothetical protein [Myxococcota bacterium]
MAPPAATPRENGRPLTFSAVFTTDRWPRRTPVWLPTSPPGVLLSPEQWVAVDREVAAYPANTPKAFRAAISAPAGHTLVMMALTATHATATPR